ncbi:MAG: hypothetical protein HQK84_04175 [Nitrospinae bacterium]|nr:hypothetical protein [Nitrospinota bacterium]
MIKEGKKKFTLNNVNGQRYIGTGIKGEDKEFVLHGVPGNDLGAFMQGPTIQVFGNAQDGVANTMSAGKIVVHGHAGDVLGYAMRGGKLFVKGDIGYRVGIHMKAYKEHVPTIVSGGRAGDFFGEYMAGGILVLLDIADKKNDKNMPITGNYVGTGMHGGEIYIRGKVEDYKLGKEVGKVPLTDEDKNKLTAICDEFCKDVKADSSKISLDDFIKLIPVTLRPYGNLYAY